MDDVFDALGERNRRAILEVLALGDQSAGEVVDAMQAGRPISQPAVSQHLKVLRHAGLVTMRAEGTRRVYSIDNATIERAQLWLANLNATLQPLTQALDALATEVVRGQRTRRRKRHEPQEASRDPKSGLA